MTRWKMRQRLLLVSHSKVSLDKFFLAANPHGKGSLTWNANCFEFLNAVKNFIHDDFLWNWILSATTKRSPRFTTLGFGQSEGNFTIALVQYKGYWQYAHVSTRVGMTTRVTHLAPWQRKKTHLLIPQVKPVKRNFILLLIKVCLFFCCCCFFLTIHLACTKHVWKQDRRE